MDVNALASEFGSAGISSNTNTGVDVHALVSEFGSKEKAKEVENLPKVYIDSNIPKPFTPEETAEALKPKINPRPMLPSTNIRESAYEADKSSQGLIDSGLNDFETGHPYKALGKVFLGSAGKLLSPLTGIIEGGVSHPATEITGSKEIGDRMGFVAGSLLPVGRINKTVTQALPKNKAINELVKDIGKENLQGVVSELKSNPRLAPVDLSPKVLQKTQNLFTTDGPQINYLSTTSANRMAGAKGAVETAYDSATGLPVNAVDKLKELKKTAQDVGSKEINPAVTGSKPVDVTPVLDHIDNIIKPGVMSKITSETTLPSSEINKQLLQVRTMLANAKEMRTDPQTLHEFQSVLRQTADGLMNSSDGAARRMGKALMNVRNKLVDTIDAASPKVLIDGKEVGTYKPALANYRDAKHIDDSFHEGYNGVFTNSKKLEGRPEFTEEWFKGLSEAEKEAAREGARLQLDTTIHNTRFAARRGQEIPEADFNRKKLELLFGKEKTDELVAALRHERNIANTHNKVIEGSQTAMRMASKEENALPIRKELGQGAMLTAAAETANLLAHGTPGVGTAMVVGSKLAGYAKHKLMDLPLAKSKNSRYAEYALPTPGPDREALIKALEARLPAPKPSMLNKVQLALPVATP